MMRLYSQCLRSIRESLINCPLLTNEAASTSIAQEYHIRGVRAHQKENLVSLMK